MKKRALVVSISILMLIEFSSIFLMWKSLSGRETYLDNVNLKDIKNNSMLAIMLEQSDGSYIESDSSVWPTDMTYNETLSGCIDASGNKINGALTYDSSTNIATVESGVTSYCYLYFDIDSVAPQTFTFYLGGSANPTYATSTSSSIYLSWSDTDIASYCVSTTNSSASCSWVNTSGTSATASYTLPSTDGTKTIYAFLKDAAGNISSAVSDTIILDTTKPTISSVSKTSDEQTSISVSVSASDTNGIQTYYFSINNGTYTSSTSNTHTFSGLTKGTSYVIRVYVKDKAGNESTVTQNTYSTKDTLGVASEYLLANPTTGLNTTMEGGLYRYQGTNANNYICFGTSTKSTCTGNTDAYMYRIMGINSSGQLKLIKKEALNSTMQWYSSYSSNITWPNSTIYSSINGSSFLNNTTYVPSGWSSKIATTSWKYGDNTSYQTGAANLYSIENAWRGARSAKIGLMYLHDYYYGMSGGNNCGSSGSTCKTSWLHLSNNDSGAPSTTEWTMSRYGSVRGRYDAYNVNSNGRAYYVTLDAAYSVRPVFYLTSDVEFVSGTGTSSDPFIIN